MRKLIFLLFLIINTAAFAQFIDFPTEDTRQVLLMNSQEFIKFAASKKIRLFKFQDPIPTESQDIATKLLESIPEVHQDDFRPFEDIFNGSTLGVYFSKHNSLLNLENDTILFSNQADRWTVAHETGHALIDQNRPLEMKKDESSDLEKLRNAKEDYEEVMSLYRNLGFFPNESYMERALDSIKTWSELMMNLLYTYELEEVRIEKFLGHLYETEPNLKLDKHTYGRSFWYIGKNCTTAKSKLDNAIDVLDHFEKIVPENFKHKNSINFKKQKENLEAHKLNILKMCSNS